ncbi:hypothetical protein MAPG_01401 [Magnaporthiopsis poae ATCC 64411]|uniref:Uncharacterized protein n=1 Tax=Magnaporthiopsis poae (strain ATCC 64411 / 73-15) TaxID=644358 RepID=A0A0C4DNK9_MAGP6|nr:hypothetical protein MAPG_01401 [Magnaporthiopsis poae ATCC 64411]
MTQTVASSLPALLNSLTQSLTSSFEATPKLSTLGTTNGISLLDVKNELLLSYLQNLVFLILLKTRTAKSSSASRTGQRPVTELNDAVVKKLVELRLYLEKGVRPLEDKLRYQIEKVLRAVDDAERQEKAEAAAGAATVKGGKRSEADSNSTSGSDDDNSGDDDDDDDADEAPGPKIADLQYRPNPAAFVRPPGADDDNSSGSGKRSSKDGIYRPPKIAPTSMPTAERRDRAADRRGGKQLRSATMDEFVNDELSAAPVAQPSIGTNIAGRGRHVKTAAERRDEAERQAYEETHFVRLQEGKKERARKEKLAAAAGRMNFGGEEWRGLGEGVDRINRLVKSKDGTGGSGGRTKALLDKSRKRALETTDGPRGSGVASVDIGERYQKRLKVQELGRTSRGKKR